MLGKNLLVEVGRSADIVHSSCLERQVADDSIFITLKAVITPVITATPVAPVISVVVIFSIPLVPTVLLTITLFGVGAPELWVTIRSAVPAFDVATPTTSVAASS